jgi:hypothetical protein
MRRLVLSLSLGTRCRAWAMCSAARTIKLRSVPAADPFIEKVALEEPDLGAGLSTIVPSHIEELGKVLDSDPSLQTSHFGPQWARWSTITRKAAAQVSSGQGKAARPDQSGEQINEMKLEQSRKALERNYQTYEEFFAHEISGHVSPGSEACDESLMLPQTEVSDVYDRHAIKSQRSVPAVNDDSTDVLPSFMNDMMTNEREDLLLTETVSQESPRDNQPRGSVPSATHTDEDTLSQCSTDPSSNAAAAGSGSTYPPDDPSLWGTEDVIRWLREFAEEGAMDESMEDAFRMVRVDGNMLLHKVSPPDLFKQMRRWHVRRQKPAAKGEAVDDAECQKRSVVVTPIMVQETIYLCFPYAAG